MVTSCADNEGLQLVMPDNEIAEFEQLQALYSVANDIAIRRR